MKNSYNNIKYEEGGVLTIGGFVGNMMPMEIFMLMEKGAEDISGDKASKIFYQAAEMQALDIIKKNFSNPSPEGNFIVKALERVSILGLGRAEIVVFDTKRRRFIFKLLNSAYAAQYKKLFGLQKKTVDHYWCGIISGILKSINITAEVKETQCVIQGKQFCVIEARA